MSHRFKRPRKLHQADDQIRDLARRIPNQEVLDTILDATKPGHRLAVFNKLEPYLRTGLVYTLTK